MTETDLRARLRDARAEMRIAAKMQPQQGSFAEMLRRWADLLDAALREDAPPPEIETLREEKRAAYAERNRLVAALSKLWPSHLADHPADDLMWDDEWRTIVCIHSPVGQLTWHIKRGEKAWFAHLAKAEGHWDGHTTLEKYARLESLRSDAPAPTGWQPEIARLRRIERGLGDGFVVIESRFLSRYDLNTPPHGTVVHVCPICDQTRESGEGHAPDCPLPAPPKEQA